MLTGLLNLARFKNGIAHPFHLPHNEKNLCLATNLIDLFQTSAGNKRYEIEEEIRALYVEKVNPKVVQGLAKLLFDRCEFTDYGDTDPSAIRETLFTTSAEYWLSGPSLTGYLEQHKKQILTSASIQSETAWQETDAWLFGDVVSNRVLKLFQTISAEKLIHRFNIEQIQGLLLHAEKIDLKLKAMKDSSFKQVMQMLKFFQLMYQVTSADSHWLSLTVDGPGSILENARSYGIEIANFFPSILLLSIPWNLTATVKIPARKRRFKLELSDQNDLQTFYRPKGVWNHEKVLNLIERFNEKYADQYTASAENRLIALSHNHYLIPDLIIKDKQDEEILAIEWIHYVTDAKISQIAKLKKELPEGYLFAMKGKKSKLEKLKKQLGHQLIVFVKELTAPALYKSIKNQPVHH